MQNFDLNVCKCCQSFGVAMGDGPINDFSHFRVSR